jgi:orotidine-5'-phosphate decarboxylase
LVRHNKLLMLDLKLNSIPETNISIFKMYEEVADLITVRCKDLRELSCYVDMSKVCWVPYLSSDNTVDTYDIMYMISQIISFNPGYVVLSPFILKRWNLKVLLNPIKPKILTPGIRFDGARTDKDGHVETLTPEEAYRFNVDYLIMGRSFYTW